MISSAQIVEQIRRVLDEPEGFKLEQFEELASRYARACERLNDLLSSAIQYHSMGFYCEAARIAREEDLVDNFQRLLFDRTDEWREHCRNLGCEIGPNISVDNGITLQTFLIKYEQNESLFVQNRLLALSNAGAAERLNTLYQLASAFPENTNAWAETIEKLEERRNLEIQKYLDSLNSQNASLSVVRELISELESPVRRTSPPEKLVSKLRKIGQFLFDRERKEELSELVQNWREAQTEHSEEDSLNYLEQYRSFVEKYGELKTNEYYNALSEEERFNLTSACQYAEELERRNDLEDDVKRVAFKLDRAVETRQSEDKVASLLEELERKTNAAGRSSLPPVAETARAYIDELQMKHRRKTVVVIASLAIGLALFAAAVCVASFNALNKKNALTLAQEIASALDEYESFPNERILATVEKKITEIEPKDVRLTKDEDSSRNLGKLQMRYERIRDAEDSRLSEIKKLVGDLEKEHEEGKSNLSALDRLSKLVKSVTEKEQYERLQKEDVALRLKRSDQVEKDFNERLAQFTDEFSKLNDDNSLSDDERLNKTNTLRTRLAELARASASLSVAQRAKLEALTSKVDAYRSARKQSNASAELTKSVGSVEAYKTSLTRIGRQLEGKEDEQIQHALGVTHLVSSVDSWNAFAEKYASIPSQNDANHEQIESFVKDAESNEDKFGFIPEYAAIKSYCQKARRSQEDDRFTVALNKLSEELANDHFSGSYYQLYHQYNDRYYYLDQEIQYGEEKTVQYLPSADGEKESFSADFMDAEDFCDEAFQYKLYQKVETLRKQNAVSENEFRKFVRDVFQSLIDAKVEELDPGVKGFLLAKISRVLSEVSGFESFGVWAKTLEETIGSNYDFYKQDSEYQQASSKVQKQLAKITSADLRSKVGDVDETSNNAFILPTYRWIGFVDFFGENASLKLGQDVDTPENAALFVATSSASMTQCGAVDEGDIKLDELDADVRWFPVFAKIIPE